MGLHGKITNYTATNKEARVHPASPAQSWRGPKTEPHGINIVVSYHMGTTREFHKEQAREECYARELARTPVSALVDRLGCAPHLRTRRPFAVEHRRRRGWQLVRTPHLLAVDRNDKFAPEPREKSRPVVRANKLQALEDSANASPIPLQGLLYALCEA